MGRIVVDTNVLWDAGALLRLQESGRPLVLPAVAFAERARQFKARGWSLQSLWKILEKVGLVVEPLGPVEAVRFAMDLQDNQHWARLSRDAFIAGHVGPGDTLWTRDVEDFVAVGVPRGQIVAI